MGTLPTANLATGALILPPPGINSNFVDPPSLELLSNILFSILLFLSIVFFACRIVYNFSVARKLKADDFFIIIAFLLGVLKVSFALTSTRFARHAWDIPTTWVDTHALKINFFTPMIFGAPTWFFSKLSILLLYLRIFNLKPITRTIIYITMLWNAGTYLPFLVIFPYYCAPRTGQDWSLQLVGRCLVDISNWTTTSTAMALLLDVVIFVLPLPHLASLNLSTKKLVGLSLVFLTGSFSVICAALSFVYRIKLLKHPEHDWTYSFWQLIITTTVENQVAIIVACIPGTAGFFRKYVRNSSYYLFATSSLNKIWPRSNTTSQSTSSYNKGGRSFGLTNGEVEGSTTYLHGWDSSVCSEIVRDISHSPRRPESAVIGRVGCMGGIEKVVDFEQRSSHKSRDSYA